MKNDKELKEDNPELYEVARNNATEKPFTGKYINHKEKGSYYCAVCNKKLFSSDTKFDSQSGWPSFTDPVNKESVILQQDDRAGMIRTEVKCKKCGAHLGHVFNDGPEIKGKVCDRYCVNSISLKFKKDE